MAHPFKQDNPRPFIAAIRLVLVLGALAALGCSGARKTEDQIIREIEGLVGSGMTLDQAAHALRERDFKNVSVHGDHGVWLAGSDETVGSQSIDFTYDEYWEGLLRRATVHVRIAFDAEGRVLRVDVDKTVDAP